MKMNVPLSELTGGGSERAREPAFYRRPGTDERETRGLECMTYNPVRNEMEVLPRTRKGSLPSQLSPICGHFTKLMSELLETDPSSHPILLSEQSEARQRLTLQYPKRQ